MSKLAIEARLAAHQGRLEEALTLARSAVAEAEPWDSLGFKAWTWSVLAEVRQARGEAAEADAATATAIDLYERKGNVAAAARLRA